ECFFSIVEVKKSGFTRIFQQWLQPLADCKAPVLQNDRPKIAFSRTRVSNGHAVKRDRGSGRDDGKPVRRELLQAFTQRGGIELLAFVVSRANTRGLPLHGRAQESVAISEPLI